MIVSMERLAAEIEADLRPTYELVYVDYRDQLTDSQLAALVRGDMETVWEETSEWESDQQWTSAYDIADEMAKDILDRWEREADDIDPDEDWDDVAESIDTLRNDWPSSDERQSVLESIMERDNSDWLTQLAAHTSGVLLRIRLGEDDFDAEWNADPEPDPAELVNLVGVDPSPENVAAAQSIIDNAQTYGTVYLLATVNPSDLLNIDRETDSLTFTDPHILLSNAYAGNGHEEQMTGEVTVPAADLRTDKDAFGYSWNEIAGVYTSAYATEMRVRHAATTDH